MDGHPNPKNKTHRGDKVSDSRFYINTWLEKEIPLLTGKVVNIGAGGSPLPKLLLNKNKVSQYTTFDQKWYGDSKNPVDVIGSVEQMPIDWTNTWDSALCIEVFECVANPFKGIDEIYRILKPGGVLIFTTPFNYRFFGQGTGMPDKKNPVKDYWRFTRDGLELLMKKFSKVSITGFGGTGEHDRFTYCVKAIK